MRESYRNSALPRRALLRALANSIHTRRRARRRLRVRRRSSAPRDVPSAHIRQTGKVVIRNDRPRHHRVSLLRRHPRVALLAALDARPRCTTRRSARRSSTPSARVTTPMPAYLSSLIADASKQHGVDPRLVAAIAARESAYNPAAVSPVGAGGVMQLMPATARYVGVDNVFDARENIFGGVRYLRTLLDTFHGDLDLTLAAYNAGPGAVQKYNGVPPYRETQEYVRIVRAQVRSGADAVALSS